MQTKQYTLALPSYTRGMHHITDKIENLFDSTIQIGIAHIFLQHTSASLCLSENVDPEVREDVESFLSDLIPEDYPKFTHTYEGSDDMPAHLKNIIIGSSLTIPISHGRLALGTWQGVYLYEHRNHGGNRNIVITLQGT